MKTPISIYLPENSSFSLVRPLPVSLSLLNWCTLCSNFGIKLGSWYHYINTFSVHYPNLFFASFGEKMLYVIFCNITLRLNMIGEKTSNLRTGIKLFQNILENDLKNFKWSIFKISENFQVIKRIWLNFFEYGPSVWTLIIELYKEFKFLIDLANYIIFLFQFILFVNKNIVIKSSNFLIFLSGILAVLFGFILSQYNNIVAKWIQKFLEKKFRFYWWLMLIYYWVWNSKLGRWIRMWYTILFYHCKEYFYSPHEIPQLPNSEPLVAPVNWGWEFANIMPNSNEKNFSTMLLPFELSSFDSPLKTLADLEKLPNTSFSDIEVEVFPIYTDETDSDLIILYIFYRKLSVLVKNFYNLISR